jgi:alkanesulfonate monooxygenase SsuD/methylene tetrahydromethanopterin reductase-like flavin-dependent oxidoreductase (luciferase family)
MSMIFGLNLPNYSSLGHRDAMIAIAEQAEELGYASLWTSDHILLPVTLPEPFGNLLETFATLSYLAARTERIQLATGILVLPQRDPLLVAKQAATVHHLSGGRMTLGVGVLFSPKPATPLPIVVGGGSRAALKRAATLGDGWHGLYLSPDEVLAAAGQLDAFGHKRQFPISLRISMQFGRHAASGKPGPGLFGDAAALTKLVRQYDQAGVDELVIEPVATELDDFLDQLTRFATEVASDRF